MKTRSFNRLCSLFVGVVVVIQFSRSATRKRRKRMAEILSRSTPTPPVGKRERQMMIAKRLARQGSLIPILFLFVGTASAIMPGVDKEATAIETTPDTISHDFVEDGAGIIEDGAEEEIRELLRKKLDETGVECVVITTNSAQTTPEADIIENLITYDIGHRGDEFLLIFLLDGRLYVVPSPGIQDRIIERHSINRDNVLANISEGKTSDGLILLLQALLPESKHITDGKDNIPRDSVSETDPG